LLHYGEVRIEAVILAGGQSRRMGADKAVLDWQGEGLAARTARLLLEAGHPVTILGGAPIPGTRHMPDEREHEGPLAALAGFRPEREAVFAAACDLPLFDARLVQVLSPFLEDAEAAVPLLEGRLQPLAALYRSSAWSALRAARKERKGSAMAWLDRLRVRQVTEDEWAVGGVSPYALRGANTPEELRYLQKLAAQIGGPESQRGRAE
jgi:molybdopterin-guanine dinucleotide biosynthesis protein A